MILTSLIAASIVSIISLIGIITLFFNDELIKKGSYFFIALSAGTMLGAAFFHIIPELLENGNSSNKVFLILLIGFASFFVLERILRWRHCHDFDKCHVHPVGMMNIVGDGLHNFIDGMLIVSSFSIDFSLGITTTFAIILHEIPQEIGDFGVLIHSGFTPTKALFLNFLTAVTAILGVFVGYFFTEHVNGFEGIILPFAAGGFLHIAASDLIPELHTEKNLWKSVISFIVFVLGLVLMY